MTTIITNKFRIANAELFKASLADAITTSNLYLFIGKPDPWTDDSTPDEPNSSILNEIECWNDMISLKKVTEAYTSHCVPRFDWTSGVHYVAYSATDADLFYHPTAAELAAANAGGYTAGSFYVMTDEYKVYKCLDNNDGAASTEKPTHTGTAIVTKADGYKWKFLYQVSNTETLRYVTDDWMPVKTLDLSDGDDGSLQYVVQYAAVAGALEIIKLVNAGSEYYNVYYSVGGGLRVFSATANTITFANDGGVSDVDDFYNGCTVFITSGTGVDQSALITDYVGNSKTATIVCDQTGGNWTINPANGDEYDILPTVAITGDGTGAVAKAIVDTDDASATYGQITSVAMTSYGTGYHYATATISGGGGTNATCTPIIGPSGGHGYDPVKELGGSYICMNIKLDYNEGAQDFPIDNDYRRIGLVKDVLDADGDIATAATLNACKSLTVASLQGFDQDEILLGNTSGAQAKFLEFWTVGSVYKMRYFQNQSTGFDAFTAGETITGQTSGATVAVTTVNSSEVTKYGGDVVYIEQRRPVTRTSSQIEDIKIIAEF